MTKIGLSLAVLLGRSANTGPAHSFCDFYGSPRLRQNFFYRDMFEQQVKKADMRAVFTEFAWNMNWCDPCAADPLSFEVLCSLGVFSSNETSPEFVPGRGRRPVMPPMGGARDVFVTPMDIRNQMNLRTADAGDGKWLQKLWTCLPAAA